jgi:hypothetical protein
MANRTLHRNGSAFGLERRSLNASLMVRPNHPAMVGDRQLSRKDAD